MKNLNLPKSVISNIHIAFILDCLDDDDMQTGIHSHEQMTDLLNAEMKDMSAIRKMICQNKSEFYQSIFEIIHFCEQGYFPLIHIHGHGDKNKGLKLPSGEFVLWIDLMEIFGVITTLAKGETTVIVSSCYSYEIVNKFFDKYEKQAYTINKIPFAFFYGYHDEVSSGIIDDEAYYINQSIMQDGGRRIMKYPPQYISTYSEYDYVDGMIAFVLGIMQQKEPNLQIIPDLSLGIFRNSVIKKNKDRGIDFNFSRKYFNSLRDNPKPILREIINDGMHDTWRKQKYLKAIEELEF